MRQYRNVSTKAINIYQWIFSIFGLTLPPILKQRNLKTWKYYMLFIVYLLYCTILICIVIYAAYVYYIFVTMVSERIPIDSITKILGYTHNFVTTIIQFYMELKTFWNNGDIKKILQDIEQLEYDTVLQSNEHWKKTTLKWKLLRVSGSSMVFMFGVLIYGNYFQLSNAVTFGMRVITLFMLMSMQLKCIEYGVYIQLVYEYLDCLSRNLVNLIEDMEEYTQSTERNLNWTLLQQLANNQIHFNRVVSLANNISHYFAYPLLMVFYYNCEAILVTVSWSYVRYAIELEEGYFMGKF